MSDNDILIKTQGNDTFKHYIITLYNVNELDQFYKDMEELTSHSHIPNRPVELIARFPTSPSTHYWLTDQEAEQIGQDPRVWGVDLAGTDGIVTFDSFSRGGNTAVTSSVNWGLWRCTKNANTAGWTNYVSGVYSNDPQTGTVNLTTTGRNVDIVIVDAGHVQMNNPELIGRVKQYNWWVHNPVVNPSDTRTQYDYTQFNSAGDADHCNHVAGIAAGTKQGWARNANVYTLSVNAMPAYAPELVVLYVNEFHKNKPINPATGLKNPTIVNNSWDAKKACKVRFSYQKDPPLGPIPGDLWHEDYVTSVVYRGITYQKGPQTGECGVYDSNGILKIAFANTATGAGYRVTTNATAATATSMTPVITRTTNSFSGWALPFPIQLFGKTIRAAALSGLGAWCLALHETIDTSQKAVGTIRINTTDSVTGRGIRTLYSVTTGSAPNRKHVLRLEGASSSTVGAADTFFEYTFYESTPAQIDVAIAANPNGSYIGWAPGQLLKYNLNYKRDYNTFPLLNVPYTPLIANTQTAISSGVIICTAAGNADMNIATPDSPDWNNTVTMTIIGTDGQPLTGNYTYYYCRGGGNSSPSIANNIITGCVNGVLNSNGLEQKHAMSNTGTGLTVYAPGDNIYSTLVSGYAYKTGTSMASPQTAGVLACALEANPTWTPAQALAWLTNSGSVANQLTSASSAGDPTMFDMLGAPNKYLYYNVGTPSPSVSITVAPASVASNSSNQLVYTITRTLVTSSALTVNYTLGGTAVPGTDYMTTAGTTTGAKTVSIPANAASVIVTATPKVSLTTAKTVVLILNSGTGYNVNSNSSTATGTLSLPVVPGVLSTSMTAGQVTGTNYTTWVINLPGNWYVSNNSYTYIGFSSYGYETVAPNRTNFGSSTAINFTRSDGATNILRQILFGYIGTPFTSEFAVKMSGASASVYPLPGTLTITMTGTFNGKTQTYGATSYTSYTNAVGTDYTRTWVFANPNNFVPVSGGQYTVSITDKAVPNVTLTVSPASVTQASGTPIVYTFTRSTVTSSALAVTYNVGSTTAAPGTDYTSTAIGTTTGIKTLTIPASAASATVTCTPKTLPTYSVTKTIALTLTSGSGYIVGNVAPVTSSIVGSSTASTITVAVSPSSVVADNNNKITFTLTRGGSTANSVTVNFTLTGTATSSQYTKSVTTNSVTMAVGVSSAVVTITPILSAVTSNVTVTLTATSGTGYTVGTPSSATATISPMVSLLTTTLYSSSVSCNSTYYLDSPSGWGGDRVTTGTIYGYTAYGYRSTTTGAVAVVFGGMRTSTGVNPTFINNGIGYYVRAVYSNGIDTIVRISRTTNATTTYPTGSVMRISVAGTVYNSSSSVRQYPYNQPAAEKSTYYRFTGLRLAANTTYAFIIMSLV